jgi:hypothetical protein
MNFLCGARTFWLFDLPKVTECSQLGVISRSDTGFGLESSFSASVAYGSKAKSEPALGQFAHAPYTPTAPDSWSVNSEVGMQLKGT